MELACSQDRDDFFEYIFLLRCMKEMDMDCDRLLAAADLVRGHSCAAMPSAALLEQ